MHANLKPALLCALLLLLATPVQAQFFDALKNALAELPRAASWQAGGSSMPSAAEIAGAPAVKAAKDIESEMAPDVTCKKPRERFNVAEKVVEYGGAAASARLQRLITSNLQYGDLDPDDREMLRYLALTTVWLPAEVEARMGSIYSSVTSIFSGRKAELSELDRTALVQIQERLVKLRGTVADYPADIKLIVNPDLKDGAYASFGGIIQLSTRFLNGLEDAGAGADFLLAHEMSHIYKRHAIKQIQFQLVSSAEGWSLARAVLQRASRGMGTDLIGDGVFTLITVPRLFEFVKSVQVKFGKDQELEADSCSTVWLKAVETDPFEAWDKFHASLGGTDTSYSSEHPSNEERAARFRRRAANEPALGAEPRVDVGTVRKEGRKMIKQGASPKKKP